ncbi:hypothetical protein V0U79_04805 [Hyphobacterium sp. HN65]|uniref:DUF4350 domain-containing protein n=1 Tax=Hyphobacterium lacteum TaxID=3116575 RepID=A0ABU7LP58_9PROT|nr:hypothetical protein [Hyphobacterium sp. HN65]MEE2525677.1 hypothetical protein [Hyphobacterium sp. HN65]
MKTVSRSITPFLTAAILIGVTGLCVYLFLQIQRVPTVPRSAVGLDGLAVLLDANDIPTRTLTSAQPFDPDAVGLRILPLYDDDPGGPGDFFVSDEDLYLNPAIRPILETVIDRKIESLPTLVVLSKWRDGIRQAGFIHPEFLLASDVVGTSSGFEAEISPQDSPPEDKPREGERDNQGFAGDAGIDQLEFDPVEFGGFRRLAAGAPQQVETVSAGRYGSADLYAPQYAIAPFNCDVMVGEAGRGLLFECLSGGQIYWVLSDPDLLNNHGLARGDNARTAINLIRDLANGGDVLIDYTTIPLLSPGEARGRSLADLLRYFGPPFRALWLAALVALIVLLWRGAIRGVPLVRRFTEGHGAARRTSFAAQAGLMRRSRADGALLKALLKSHLAVLSDRLLGRDIPRAGRRDRLLRAIRHRDAATADDLETAIREIDSLADTAGTDATVPVLARLESAYRKALELS